MFLPLKRRFVHGSWTQEFDLIIPKKTNLEALAPIINNPDLRFWTKMEILDKKDMKFERECSPILGENLKKRNSKIIHDIMNSTLH